MTQDKDRGDKIRLVISLIVKLDIEKEVFEKLKKRASTPQGQQAP